MDKTIQIIREINSEKEIVICAEIMSSSDPWITLGITKKEMIRTLNDPLLEIFVVENDNEIIGTFVLQTKGAFTGYLKSIAIKENWRGKNLGEFMMDFIEKRIFAGSPNVFLCVSSFNKKAQKFYSKLGYEKVGLLKNYVIQGHDEILMRKTKGPILSKTVNF
ncbi:MAG: GNAT family N-acetyltransferase [Bacteroidota bacterium]